MTGKRSRRAGRLILIGLEVALAVAIVYSILAWRSRDMLESGETTPAPALEGRILDGDAFRLSDLQGRPALVYFFAPWCRICRFSIPNLHRVGRYGPAELVVVPVALDWADAGEVREFVKRTGLEIPVVMADRANIRSWQVPGYPSYYLLDADHRIRARDFGYATSPGLLWRAWRADLDPVSSVANVTGVVSAERPVP